MFWIENEDIYHLVESNAIQKCSLHVHCINGCVYEVVYYSVLKIRGLCLALRPYFRDIDYVPQSGQSKHWMQMSENLTNHSKLPGKRCHVENYDTLLYMLD